MNTYIENIIKICIWKDKQRRVSGLLKKEFSFLKSNKNIHKNNQVSNKKMK